MLWFFWTQGKNDHMHKPHVHPSSVIKYQWFLWNSLCQVCCINSNSYYFVRPGFTTLKGFSVPFLVRVSHLPPHLERGSLLDSEMPGIGAFTHNERCKIVHSEKFSADLPHTQHSNQRTAPEDKSYTDKWFLPLCCAACCTEQWLHWTIHRISITFSKIQPHCRRYHTGALSSSALQLALSVHLGSKSCKGNPLVSQGCFPCKMNPKAPFFK